MPNRSRNAAFLIARGDDHTKQFQIVSHSTPTHLEPKGRYLISKASANTYALITTVASPLAFDDVNHMPAGIMIWKLFFGIRKNHSAAGPLCEFRPAFRRPLVAPPLCGGSRLIGRHR